MSNILPEKNKSNRVLINQPYWLPKPRRWYASQTTYSSNLFSFDHGCHTVMLSPRPALYHPCNSSMPSRNSTINSSSALSISSSGLAYAPLLNHDFCAGSSPKVRQDWCSRFSQSCDLHIDWWHIRCQSRNSWDCFGYFERCKKIDCR